MAGESLTRAQARASVARFRGKVIGVVGDLMLDEFVAGDASRISPEAPVPVVLFESRSFRGGGAANAAANIVSLGGSPVVLGVIGSDTAGDALTECLRAQGVTTTGILKDAARPTTHKLRVVARGQQIVRVDTESHEHLSPVTEASLLRSIEELAPKVNAWLLSDYAKGLLSEAVCERVVRAAEPAGIPVLVDPKGRSFSKYRGASVLTPNTLELELATGIVTHNQDPLVEQAVTRLSDTLPGTIFLVTRGARGMTLVQPGEKARHFPTVAQAVFDVTGAGDSVIGAIALCLSSHATWNEALFLASHAAGIAVSKHGTVAVTDEELIASFPETGP